MPIPPSEQDEERIIFPQTAIGDIMKLKLDDDLLQTITNIQFACNCTAA